MGARPRVAVRPGFRSPSVSPEDDGSLTASRPVSGQDRRRTSGAGGAKGPRPPDATQPPPGDSLRGLRTCGSGPTSGPSIAGRGPITRRLATLRSMARMGPTRARDSQGPAANLLKLARARTGVSQARVAALAGVPRSMVARIEAGTRQPSLPPLGTLLASVDLDMRIRLEPYDDHDHVLDANYGAMTPEQRAATDACRGGRGRPARVRRGGRSAPHDGTSGGRGVDVTGHRDRGPSGTGAVVWSGSRGTADPVDRCAW